MGFYLAVCLQQFRFTTTIFSVTHYSQLSQKVRDLPLFLSLSSQMQQIWYMTSEPLPVWLIHSMAIRYFLIVYLTYLFWFFFLTQVFRTLKQNNNFVPWKEDYCSSTPRKVLVQLSFGFPRAKPLWLTTMWLQERFLKK